MVESSRAIELSWKLLKHKLMYYHPELVDKSWHKELVITDLEYDTLEQEAKALGISVKVGYPMDSPSGQLVIQKYSKPKGRLHD